MKLSAAATIVLTRAAERPDHRLQFHRKLPTGGRHKMIDALLRDGLIAETLGDYRLGDASTLIEDSATGLMLTTLVLTDVGFRAIDRDPPAPATDADTAPPAASNAAVAREAAAIADALDAATVAPTARATLRSAAAAALAAFDKRGDDVIASFEMCEAMLALRTALAEKPARAPGGEKTPRAMTGAQSILVALCQREQGATAKELADGAGWPSIAARSVMTKIAERFGFTMSEKPKAAGRGVTFYLSTPQA